MSITSTFVSTVTDGPLLFALPVAAAAGLVSFLSPCVLPLVPGYLSYVTGLTGVDLAAGTAGVAPTRACTWARISLALSRRATPPCGRSGY